MVVNAYFMYEGNRDSLQQTLMNVVIYEVITNETGGRSSTR
jgi:hypothetical protein